MRQSVSRILVLASLGAVSSTAWAKDPNFGEFVTEVGNVQIQGTVEVPLYDMPGYEMLPVVEAMVGETRLFLAVDPSVDDIGIYGSKLAGLGLDTKDKGDAYATAVVESLSIGSLTLSDVLIATQASSEVNAQRWQQYTSAGRQTAMELDGYIGLGALPELAWAIVPSAGVVRFVAADQGDALVSSVGTAVQGGTTSGQSFRIGFVEGHKTKRGKTKTWSPSWFAVPVKVNGQDRLGSLRFGPTGSMFTPDDIPDATVAESLNGRRLGPARLAIGGIEEVQTVVAWDRSPSITKEYYDESDNYVVADGSIGRLVSGQFDLAYNPASGAFSLKKVTAAQRHDPIPLILSDAEAALKKAMETPKDAEEEVKKGTTLPEGTAPTWTSLAKAKEAAGDIQGALEAWETVAKFEPNECQGWMNYGVRLLEYGKPPGQAKEALTTASSLYHAWWDWAPETRAAFGDILEKAGEAGEDYYFQPDDIGFVEVDGIRERDVAMGAPAPKLPETGALIKEQPDACEEADGHLARIALLSGDFDSVETYYRNTLDLNAFVADVQGAAAVVRGEPEKAQAALRQAIILEWKSGKDGTRRSALASAYIAAGDRESADKLLETAISLTAAPVVYEQWAANSIELRGVPQTAALIKARSDWNVYDTSAHLTWLSLTKQTGNAKNAEEAAKRVEAALAFDELHLPNSPMTHITAARYALLTDNLEDAKAHAKLAREYGPEFGASWAISAEVAEAEGNTQNSTMYRRKAAQASPTIVPYLEKALADSE